MENPLTNGGLVGLSAMHGVKNANLLDIEPIIWVV